MLSCVQNVCMLICCSVAGGGGGRSGRCGGQCSHASNIQTHIYEHTNTNQRTQLAHILYIRRPYAYGICRRHRQRQRQMSAERLRERARCFRMRKLFATQSVCVCVCRAHKPEKFSTHVPATTHNIIYYCASYSAAVVRPCIWKTVCVPACSCTAHPPGGQRSSSRSLSLSLSVTLLVMVDENRCQIECHR